MIIIITMKNIIPFPQSSHPILRGPAKAMAATALPVNQRPLPSSQRSPPEAARGSGDRILGFPALHRGYPHSWMVLFCGKYLKKSNLEMVDNEGLALFMVEAPYFWGSVGLQWGICKNNNNGWRHGMEYSCHSSRRVRKEL